ncbi:putative 54S ribosomal protein L40, mitochondrial [Bisporella sp. PMI_857]|nr:putative 54S ribosomal protein L40, mitochondrial [Bisporella sp. PMI_857]
MDIKQAAINRREDWELGPLAPKRDVGSKKDTYGTIDGQRLRGPALPTKEREAIMKMWGGTYYLNIAKGDRMVILEGRDKGRIGTIGNIDEDRCEVTLEGLNMIDVEVPKWMQVADETDQRPVRSVEQPVSLKHVRLVAPLKTKGQDIRDVIIKEIGTSHFIEDRDRMKLEHRRFIAGTHTEIPWPLKEDEDIKDQPGDTLRLDVEVRTFVPTLLRPPMPLSVIDELRNRFSKFRTRHDPEYIEAKMQEDREKQAKKAQIKEMETPLKALHKQEQRLRRKMAKKQILSPKMLTKIGAILEERERLGKALEQVQKGLLVEA